MKLLLRCLFLFLFYFAARSIDAQIPDSDKNFLRDYCAPDFRYREMNLTGRSSLEGTRSDADIDLFELSPSLQYNQFTNLTNRQQGISFNGSLATSFWRQDDTSSWGSSVNASNSMKNWFYFNNEWFVGFHDQSSFSFLYSYENGANSANQSALFFRVQPAVSIGYGRVEWVHFARSAMDIEYALKTSGRLGASYDENDRKALADGVAANWTRRFFDDRFGRIEQLESLDSLLNQEGLITQADIRYFSQLQDAFLYSRVSSRQSGVRHEFGLSPRLISLTSSTSGVTNNIGSMTSFGYYTFALFLPQSYALQHNLSATTTFGFEDDLTADAASVMGWFDVNYSFGVYPTTRTYFGVFSNMGVFLESNNSGLTGKLGLNAYYWLSPRLRLSGNGSFGFEENYSSHLNTHLGAYNFVQGDGILNYEFDFRLAYALF